MNRLNLILATKAFQANDALQGTMNRINEEKSIIILCNGALAIRDSVIDLMKATQNFESLPALHLALTSHGAYRDDILATEEDNDGLWHMIHAGFGRTVLENYPEMEKLWDMAGLNCRSVKGLARDLWFRLAANCVINPLTAVHQCSNGE